VIVAEAGDENDRRRIRGTTLLHKEGATPCGDQLTQGEPRIGPWPGSAGVRLAPYSAELCHMSTVHFQDPSDWRR
jgi:hypothetical protein